MGRGQPKSKSPKKRKLQVEETKDQQEACVVTVLPPQTVSSEIHNSLDNLSSQQIKVLMDVMNTRMQQLDSLQQNSVVEVESCEASARPKRNVKSVYATPKKSRKSQDLIDDIDTSQGHSSCQPQAGPSNQDNDMDCEQCVVLEDEIALV